MTQKPYYTKYQEDSQRKFTQLNSVLITDKKISKLNTITVKPVYNGHTREPENVPFMNSCPLYTS